MVNTRTHIRRTALTVACGIGLFQAGVLGVGATQPSTPSNETPVTQPDESPSDTPPGAKACAIGVPGIPESFVITDGEGTSITITITIGDSGSGAASVAIATDDDSTASEDRSAPADPESTPAEGEDGAADVTESSGGERTTESDKPESATNEAADAVESTGDGEINVIEGVICEAVGEPSADSSEEANEAVEADEADDEQPTFDATGDESTPEETGATISPAAAIAIAETVVDGDIQSLVLNEDGGRLVYEITVGDQLVIVDAMTGELVPTTDQP